MQLLKRSRVVVASVVIAAGLGLAGRTLALAEAQAPSAQGAGMVPSGQMAVGGSPPATTPQSQVVYQTVNTVECVQVPVTLAQTQYRTEYRTETVPVTRMVPECVNETRTITRYIPQQETINKQVITHYVCEPTTVMTKCYRPVPVTKTVQRTLYQTYCTTELVTREITRFVPECVTETVPVTRTHKVVEPQVCYVTQKVPVTSMVPVVTCSHSCGHKCSGGCGACGGVTTCVQYTPVTTYACQQVPVTRPMVKYVPETTYVQRTRTKLMPVKQTIQCPQVKVNKIPYQVTQCINTCEFQSYDVPVTKIVRRPMWGTVPVCVTRMIPQSTTIVVPTVRCKPVTETVTRQVAVCVPYQVPVTVMTTQQRTVAHQVPVIQSVPVAAPQSAPAGSAQEVAPAK
jgi:hypothetical protein